MSFLTASLPVGMKVKTVAKTFLTLRAKEQNVEIDALDSEEATENTEFTISRRTANTSYLAEWIS